MSNRDTVEIIKVRIRYIRGTFRYLRKGTYTFTIAILLMFIIKWFVSIPQLIAYIQTPNIESLMVIRASIFAMAILNVLLLVAIILFFIFLGKLTKMKCIVVLDISRMLLLFATLAAFLRAILWFLFAGAFFTMQFNAFWNIGTVLMRIESSMEISLSFSMVFFAFFFLQNRDIIRKATKVNIIYPWLLFLLAVISLLEVAFLIIFFVLLLKKRRIVYSLAYVDIKV